MVRAGNAGSERTRMGRRHHLVLPAADDQRRRDDAAGHRADVDGEVEIDLPTRAAPVLRRQTESNGVLQHRGREAGQEGRAEAGEDPLAHESLTVRSDERRVGNEGGSTCSIRWSPYQ